MSTQQQNNNLSKQLDELTRLANQAGAEGLWIIRGATDAVLLYSLDDGSDPASDPVVLDIADAELLILMRFSAGDGGEPGIESR